MITPTAGSFDVAVVGAGPAGSAAAWRLAQSGVRVVLLERDRPPRYKTCGGGVVARTHARLPVALAPLTEAAFPRVDMSLLDNALSLVAERAEPVISMVMRATFDQALMEAAREAGAVLRAPQRVTGIELKPDAVTLHTDRGDVRAAFVVAADGAGSVVARAAGWPETRRLIPALEWEIEVGAPIMAKVRSRARFDFGLPSHGYAWVFPKAHHLSVGVLSTHPRHPGLARALHSYLGRLGLDSPTRIERHGFVIPVGARTDTLARDRVLLVGDAAGLADPVTAEGISSAWHSGELAALALVESELRSPECERTYCQRVDRELLGEQRAAARLARLLYEHPRLRGWALRHYGPRLVDAVCDVFTGERSYRGLLRDPRSYIALLRRPRGV